MRGCSGLKGLRTTKGRCATAAAKAIELDPNLGEAHAAMAWIKFADWDWAGAEQEARHAIALNLDVDEYFPSPLDDHGAPC